VARLTAEAVIEQRSDGHYDQTASRLRYIKHLRAEHRRSPRVEADADHVKVKTEMEPPSSIDLLYPEGRRSADRSTWCR
jgi:hypothetical protein